MKAQGKWGDSSWEVTKAVRDPRASGRQWRKNLEGSKLYRKWGGRAWEFLLLYWLLLDWPRFWDLMINTGLERVKWQPRVLGILSNYSIRSYSASSHFISFLAPFKWEDPSNALGNWICLTSSDCFSQLDRIFLSSLSCGLSCSWPYSLSAHYQDICRVVRNPKRDS